MLKRGSKGSGLLIDMLGMLSQLLFAVSLSIASLSHASNTELNAAVRQCAGETDSLKRLVCYDDLAKKFNLNAKQEYIHPDQDFLSSKLVVKPWEPEYSLSIADFVQLISSAVLEDGTKVKVRGWTRQDDRYVLDIVMRSPVKLTFLPADENEVKQNLSLLEPVVIKGRKTEASQFVMVIATMVPDSQ